MRTSRDTDSERDLDADRIARNLPDAIHVGVATALLDVDLCATEHRDCDADVIVFRNVNEAHLVQRLHAGDGPSCRQYLAGHAYITEAVEEH